MKTKPIPSTHTLPHDSAQRKDAPMAEGLLYYFPAALTSVARISKIGNDKHNPGQPLHHSRGKSMDHADCIVRHLVDMREDHGFGVGYDENGVPVAAYVAWRALALCQEWFESQGAPVAPNAKVAEPEPALPEPVLSEPEPEFQVGDKVVCVDSSEWEDYLTEGKEYTVHKVDASCIEINGVYFFTRRFRKVIKPEPEPEPAPEPGLFETLFDQGPTVEIKPGDLVVCVDAEGTHLVEGKEYWVQRRGLFNLLKVAEAEKLPGPFLQYTEVKGHFLPDRFEKTQINYQYPVRL